MAREEYNAGRFVGRAEPLQQILGWAVEPAPYQRLVALVAPPGMGKSWLIQKALSQLRAQQSANPGARCVFELDLSIDPTQTPYRRRVDLSDRIQRYDWLAACIEQAGKDQCCAGFIRPFSPTVDFDAAIDTLVEDLCLNCHPVWSPVLVVDGFDEATIDQSWLEEHLLKRFLQRDCTRILLARRDEYAMRNYFLRGQEKIIVLDGLQQGEEQEQLIRRSIAPGVSLNLLQRHTNHYHWNHPSLNASLYVRAAENQTLGRSTLLSCQDLEIALKETVFPNGLTSAAWGLLIKLAHLTDGQGQLKDWWTEQDARLQPDDKILDQLFIHGLVHTVPRSQFRQVANGIRELVRDWQSCLQSSQSPGDTEA